MPTSTKFHVLLSLKLGDCLINAINFTINALAPIEEREPLLLALFGFSTVVWGSLARVQWMRRRAAQRETSAAESVGGRERRGEGNSLLGEKEVGEPMREVKAWT